MTEAEWLDSVSSLEMLYFLHSNSGRAKLRRVVSSEGCERKLRLFLAACCRRLWRWLIDERSRRAVTVAEQYVDGQASREELEAAHAAAAAAYAELRRTANATAYCAAGPPVEASRVPFRKAFDVCIYGADVASMAPAAHPRGDGPPLYDESVQGQERATQADLLRDIFGNPFRKAALADQSLTPTVLALARQMYESGDFGSILVLADALEEAGCTDPAILSHCRGPAPHVHGCWVVDLILGKQ
jgi:hypothetical protein